MWLRPARSDGSLAIVSRWRIVIGTATGVTGIAANRRIASPIICALWIAQPCRALTAARRSDRFCGGGLAPETAASAAAILGSPSSGLVGLSNLALAFAASAAARSLAAASRIVFSATLRLLVVVLSPAAR